MTLPTPLDVSPRIRVHADRDAAGVAAAADAAATLRACLAKQEQARIILAAAPSQREMLDHLARSPRIEWSRVAAFHMDEYLDLPDGAAQRFGSWLTEAFFERVSLGEVHLIETHGDAERRAADYAARLAAAPIDLVCLGIGVNGHIAFNDPPVADFDDPVSVKVVELDEICRRQQVDDACFARLAEVPRRALTLTIPRLMAADRLVCVVPGFSKCTAVGHAFRGPLSTAWPASVLRTHHACTVHLDREAARDLS